MYISMSVIQRIFQYGKDLVKIHLVNYSLYLHDTRNSEEESYTANKQNEKFFSAKYLNSFLGNSIH